MSLWNLGHRLFPNRPISGGRARVDKLLCDAVRRQMAATLEGKGLEIGAQAFPFPVDPKRCRVQHADVRPREEQPGDYRHRSVPVDHLLPPGGSLESLPEETFDFLVACHVLEHVWDVKGTLADWSRVLKPDGRLVLVLPDRRHNPFDAECPPTDADALVARPAQMWGEAHREHLLSDMRGTRGMDEGALQAKVDRIMAEHGYPHVNHWTCPEFLAMAPRIPALREMGLAGWWHHPAAFEFGAIFTKSGGPLQVPSAPPVRWVTTSGVAKALVAAVKRRL